jgi:hypothetical protein
MDLEVILKKILSLKKYELVLNSLAVHYVIQYQYRCIVMS